MIMTRVYIVISSSPGENEILAIRFDFDEAREYAEKIYEMRDDDVNNECWMLVESWDVDEKKATYLYYGSNNTWVEKK